MYLDPRIRESTPVNTRRRVQTYTIARKYEISLKFACGKKYVSTPGISIWQLNQIS